MQQLRSNSIRKFRLEKGFCPRGCGERFTGFRCLKCAEVDSLRFKNWKAKNPDYYRKKRSVIRLAVIRFYGRKCACCSERELSFLAVDHVGGGGHKQKVETKVRDLTVWIFKNGFPAGFRILCHNCNNSISILGKCHGTNHLGLHRE